MRDAGELLDELNHLQRCDCTTRNAKRAAALGRRMDDLERRIAELREQEELDSIRPPLDGRQVMAHLGVPPGRVIGDALEEFLVDSVLFLEVGEVVDEFAAFPAEAVVFFQDIPGIQRKLRTLFEVGLGYIRIGQQATTLSGGEAQRVKLSTELSKIGTGNTLYILDEPTTGLHFEDVRMLLGVLDRLVDKGNTVMVIEHNLDVIKTADWVIDLGPGGGSAGGQIVAEGTPEEIAKVVRSATAEFLQHELRRA